GRKRRLVLMLEWLTLCPTCAVLPVKSHRRDMAVTSKSPDCLLVPRRACGRAIGPSAARREPRGPISSTGKGGKAGVFAVAVAAGRACRGRYRRGQIGHGGAPSPCSGQDAAARG